MRRWAIAGLLGLMIGIGAQPANAGTFFYCVVQDYNGRETRFVSDLREAEVDKIDTMNTGFAYSDEIAPQWNRAYPGDGSRKSYCSSSTNRAYIEKEMAQLLANSPGARKVPFTRSPVASKPAKPQTGLILAMPTTKSPSDTKEGSTKSASAAVEAERARAAERERREAEFQAKLAAHEAQVADYQRKVKAREAEIARQQAEHAAAQEKARQVQAAHAKKLAEAQQAREEWLAVKRRHDRCMAGDQQACADMAAGKPATAEKLADAGEAQTSDDEARMCVTDPVLGESKIWKGALAATIINGCTKAVDARICLQREGGWNCGVYWGLKPQQPWTWTSFKATGELFWDARIAGTGRPLGSPE